MFNLELAKNGIIEGDFRINPIFFLKRKFRSKPSQVSISTIETDDYEEIKSFIEKVYRDYYGANLNITHPYLISVRNSNGKLMAAAGFRYASEEPLFLEKFLDKSIETVLKCDRSEVVEIGNLASIGGGGALLLFASLASYLNKNGKVHAVTISTEYLHKKFKKMELKPCFILKPDAEEGLKIGPPEIWGTYFNSEPCIISGLIPRGCRRLGFLMGMKYTVH